MSIYGLEAGCIIYSSNHYAELISYISLIVIKFNETFISLLFSGVRFAKIENYKRSNTYRISRSTAALPSLLNSLLTRLATIAFIDNASCPNI